MDYEQVVKLMRIAINAGKKSISEEGKKSPSVGAVLFKDGKIYGPSFRGQHGEGDHAEYTLFNKEPSLKDIDVTGATLFTTLEPCTHRNNHKPCTEWILEKQIAQVYIGMLDPNPRIYNVGATRLKKNGVEVDYFPPELRREIETDNTLFREQYNANPELKGHALFNYTNNNGIYTIGNGEMMFNTKWSTAGHGSIHAYKDTVKTIAIAEGNASIVEVKDGSIYDNSSRARTLKDGQILIVENGNGYFAAIKINAVHTKGVDGRDEITFEYVILPDKTANFTRLD